ncbi:MAG: hypothetical protein WBA44_02345 [Mesorhizobium sp.]
MDAIEQAVRSAFAKGNPDDPAFRERVYRSAQSALEKAVAANPTISPDAVARRRQKLLDVVASIESEFARSSEVLSPAPTPAPARQDTPPAAPDISIDPARTAPATPRAEPRFEPAAEPRLEPRLDQPASARNPSPQPPPQRREPGFASSGPAPEIGTPQAEPVTRQTARAMREEASDAPRERERRRFPWGLVAGLTILIVVIGLVFWTAVELGFVKSSSNAQSTPSASVTRPGAEHEPGGAESTGGLHEWMPVFAPSDPTTAIAAAGARAEVLNASGDQVMRITSGRSGAPVRLEIGQGVLERLAGKRAIFDIVARGGDGKETQMSVTCVLQGMEGCGRNRYAVGIERGEYLFEVDVPANAGRGTGSIEIVSDISSEGKSVDLIEVRASTAEAAAN